VPCELKVQVNKPLSFTSDLVRRDSSIPGLGMMLDPERLLAALHGQLDIRQVDHIKLNYLRYKPGMNCLACYELRVEGQTIHAYAKSHGYDAASKWDKAVERPVVNNILGPGRVLLEEEQIVFSTFPNDAKLSSLQRLGDDDFRKSLLSRVFGDDSAWQGSEVARVLNYKPERRYVVRLKREDGRSALAKFYTRSGFGKARTISQRLRGESSTKGQYPEIIGFSRKHGVIAYRWWPGDSLRDMDTDGKLSLSDVEETARVLAQFHASGPANLLAPKPLRQAARISALGEQVGFLIPDLKQRAENVAQGLIGWLSNQPLVNQPVHGDFYDKQVIVNSGHVRLIDLDGACLGNPLVDLGSYVAHLERHAINEGKAGSGISSHQQALVSAYEQATGPISTTALNKYIALGLFGLIHHPFRDWADNWPEQTELLLQRVEALVQSEMNMERLKMNNSPRIGYILKVYPRTSQTFVLTEILAHERAGLKIDIFSLRRTDDTRFHAALARVQSPVFQVARGSTKATVFLKELREHGHHLPNLWDVVENSHANAEDLLQAARISRAVIERGIIHLHAHFGTVATVVARLVMKITGISYSYTAHAKDIFHEIVDEKVLRKKLADAAGVITVSQFNVAFLKDKYTDAAKHVRLIYNGLDLDKFRFETDTERLPIILAVGRLVEKKGFSYLLDACAILRSRGINFRCEVVGGGELESELLEQFQKLDLGDYVTLCGPMSQSDVKKKIRQARILAAPCVHAQDQDRDGLPTILLEAMALGTPCISTPVTGIPEVLIHEETGLMVPERDETALADACQRLLEDTELCGHLTQNGRQLIEANFDIDKNTAKIRAFFSEMSGVDLIPANTMEDA